MLELPARGSGKVCTPLSAHFSRSHRLRRTVQALCLGRASDLREAHTYLSPRCPRESRTNAKAIGVVQQ